MTESAFTEDGGGDWKGERIEVLVEVRRISAWGQKATHRRGGCCRWRRGRVDNDVLPRRQHLETLAKYAEMSDIIKKWLA
ncbi:MAG: hypothetical protein ACO2PN_25865 [Pyrobaculum sp.]|jgi:hypothetical protein